MKNESKIFSYLIIYSPILSNNLDLLDAEECCLISLEYYLM